MIYYREETDRDKVRLYDLRKQTEEQFDLLSYDSPVSFLNRISIIENNIERIEQIQQKYLDLELKKPHLFYINEDNQNVIKLAGYMLRDFAERLRELNCKIIFKGDVKTFNSSCYSTTSTSKIETKETQPIEVKNIINITTKETQPKQSRTNSFEYKLLVACLIFWGVIFVIFLGAFVSSSQKQTIKIVNADVNSYAYDEKIEGTANPRDRVTVYIDGEKKETVKTSLKGKWITKGKYSGLIKVKKRKINQK